MHTLLPIRRVGWTEEHLVEAGSGARLGECGVLQTGESSEGDAETTRRRPLWGGGGKEDRVWVWV